MKYLQNLQQIYSKKDCSACVSTAQKMKFSIKNFFSKCDQIRRKLQIWSHLLKKYLQENFIFCAVIPKSQQKKVTFPKTPIYGLMNIMNEHY